MKVPGLYELSRALKPLRRRLRRGWYVLTGQREKAVVRIAREIRGMFRDDEIRLLYRTTASAPGPGDIAEIGSWMGRTSVVMGLALRDAGVRDCRIYAIDHHVGSEEHVEFIARQGSTLDAFRRNVAAAGVRELVEEIVMKSVEGAKELAARGVRLRMAFIDGAHDEESVRQDIRAMLPLLEPRALVLFHDYLPEAAPGTGYPGVHRAFQTELADRVEIVDRAFSLLVTRLKR